MPTGAVSLGGPCFSTLFPGQQVAFYYNKRDRQCPDLPALPVSDLKKNKAIKFLIIFS